MLSKLILACFCIGNIVKGQIYLSSGTLSSSNDFEMQVAIVNFTFAAFEIQGPSDKWFGVGWGSDEMPDTYAMIIADDTDDVVERTLGDNSGGTELTSSIFVINDTTVDDVRTVTFFRFAEASSSAYYDFSDVTSGSIDIIWAVGSSETFAQHASRGSTSMHD